MARKNISGQLSASSARLTCSMPCSNSPDSTGVKLQNSAAISVPARLATSTIAHSRAMPRDVAPGKFGQYRQHHGDGAFGEQLLARQHHHQKADE